jgi:hypothetical protein
MGMVRTAHPYFALGIEEVGVGEYMRMSVLYFFGRRIATVSDLSVKRHYRVTVCCARSSKVRQLVAPSNARVGSTSLHLNARKAHHCQP